jgi:uncharacterized protein
MRRKDRELMDKKDLLAILDEADVCRIAIQTGKAPYIVPLNFGYAWEENLVLYFHSAMEGRKLELLGKNNSVGFELDTGHELVTADLACNWGMKYKSIIGTGEIHFIEDDKEKALALDAIMRKYSFAGTAMFSGPNLRSVKVFRLVAVELSGKQKR